MSVSKIVNASKKINKRVSIKIMHDLRLRTQLLKLTSSHVDLFDYSLPTPYLTHASSIEITQQNKGEIERGKKKKN